MSKVFFLQILLWTAWTLGSAHAENWPQFRGPNAAGTSKTPAPITWEMDSARNVLWTTPVLGLAHAGPILWKDHVYLATVVKPGAKAELKIGLYGDIGSYQENEPHQWRLLCLERRTGKVVWDKLAHEAVPRVERHTKASHCNSTPATDGKRIAAILGSEGLFVFSMKGEPLWHAGLGKMDPGFFSSPTALWGFASSPVLHDDRVIVQCDVLSEQYVAAFDAATGRELWRTPRKEVPTWSTPTVATWRGHKQVIVNGWKHIAGYDFKTGEEIWRLEGGGDIPVPTPVVAHDLIYLTSAHGRYRPIRAVRLGATGDVSPPDIAETNAAIAWSHPRLGSYMQTPIVVGALLFSCDWNGVLTCLDARTGTVHYSERLAGGRQGFTASPVAAGDRLYFTAEAGHVYVVAAEPRLNVLATNRFDAECLATPALADGALYFRTRERLVAIGSR